MTLPSTLLHRLLGLRSRRFERASILTLIYYLLISLRRAQILNAMRQRGGVASPISLFLRPTAYGLQPTAIAARSGPSSFGCGHEAALRLRVALCGVLLLPLPGCMGDSPRPPGYAVVGLDTAPLTLDPRFSTDATAAQIEGLLFEGLTDSDERQQRHGNLASAWEQPDDRTYIFFLRSGLRFSDGSALDAADVKATYESVLNPSTRSPKRDALTVIEQVDAMDAHTVRFRLLQAQAGFLASTGLGILPSEQVGTGSVSPLAKPIGSGPFRLADAQATETLVLLPNPNYPAAKPHLTGIVFRVIPDAITRLLELKRGTIDLVQSGIDPDSMGWLRTQNQLAASCIPATAFQYLGMNLRDPRLADRRIRRAIAYALDRDAITDSVLNGLAQPANSLLPPGHWAHYPRTPQYKHNPAKARRLLDHAGWPDPDGNGPMPRFRLRYTTTNVELRRRLAEAMQAQLAEVGIELEIRSYEWATFYHDVRQGNFEIYSLAWIGIEDPDLFFQIFHSQEQPPRGMNRGFFADARMDRLTLAARQNLDPQQRRALYAAVQIRAARQLPVIPLWWPSQCAVHTTRLHEYVPSPDGSYASLSNAWLDPAGI